MEGLKKTWLCRIICNFHRQLSSVYRQKTCFFLEELSDPAFIKTHPFLKFGKIPTPPTIKTPPHEGPKSRLN